MPTITLTYTQLALVQTAMSEHLRRAQDAASMINVSPAFTDTARKEVKQIETVVRRLSEQAAL